MAAPNKSQNEDPSLNLKAMEEDVNSVKNNVLHAENYKSILNDKIQKLVAGITDDTGLIVSSPSDVRVIPDSVSPHICEDSCVGVEVVEENKVLLDEDSGLLYKKLRADVDELQLKFKKVMEYFVFLNEKVTKLTIQFSHSAFTESPEGVSSSLNPNLQTSAIHSPIPLLSERDDDEDKENEPFMEEFPAPSPPSPGFVF